MQLGPYQIVRPVGRGGSSAVFEGKAPDGRRVAIKLLTRTGATAFVRFERERRLLTDLAGAGGIVPVLDAGTSREGVYLVMPFVPGGTLRDRLAKGRLSLEETLALARPLAATVARCHARGVVHRDLKPENVLLDEDGAPLVTDLGLAKHFRDDVPGASRSEALSRTGEMRGTPGYAAPEQLGDAKAAAAPADVFALGLIIYECLCGEPAFVGETALDLFTAVAEGRFTPLSTARPDAPAWLVAVVHRAMSTDPAARQADAAELLAALDAPAAPPAGVPRALTLAAALAASVLVATTLVLALRTDRPPARPAADPPPATPTAPVPPAEEARRWLERGQRKLFALELRHAARDFERATELDPTLAAAWAGRAWALEAYAPEGSSLDPLRFAERAVELDPKAASSWIARSFARAREEPTGAVEDGRHAVALDPRDPQAHVALGHAIGVGEEDWAAAVPHLDAALALDPGEPHALVLRALARLGREDIEPDLRRALERAPRSHLALRLLSRSREERGDLAGALEAIRAATRADPEDARGWHELGLLLVDDPVAAEDAFTRVLQLDAPRSLRPYRHRGEARLKRRDLPGAQADLQLATVHDGEDGAAWHLLGQAHLGQRQFGAAAAALERSLELTPEVALAWLALAECRAATGKLRPALDAIEQAATLAPDHPAVHFGRAQLLEALRDLPGARASLARYFELATPATPRFEEAKALQLRLQ